MVDAEAGVQHGVERLQQTVVLAHVLHDHVRGTMKSAMPALTSASAGIHAVTSTTPAATSTPSELTASLRTSR